jgi:acyl-CoA reductase-like NAD-dependent aldehyde dehydrogenase
MPGPRRSSSRSRSAPSPAAAATSASSPLLSPPSAAAPAAAPATTTTMADGAPLKYTPVGDIPGIVAATRAAFDAGTTRPLAWRRAQLRAIKALVEENADAFKAALQADLRRPEFECVVHESFVVVSEVKMALSQLSAWTARTPVPTPAGMLPGTSWTQPDPLGVVSTGAGAGWRAHPA